MTKPNPPPSPRLDWRGADLRGVTLPGNMDNADLRGCNLACAYGARMPEPAAVQQPTPAPAPAAGNGNGIRGTLRNQLDAPAKPRHAPQQKKPEQGRHH